MDAHMDWLLNLAARLRTNFYDTSVEGTIKLYLNQCIEDDSTIIQVDASALEQQAPFFIIAQDPKQVFYSIIERLRTELSDDEQSKFRPMSIITKLGSREFVLDVGGNQLIYAVSSKYTNDALVKSMICRSLYSIKRYFNQISQDTNTLLPEAVSLVDPADPTIVAGRSKAKQSSKHAFKLGAPGASSGKTGLKVRILSRLVEYVKSNPTFMGSLIYLNTLNDIDNHALDMIYSDPRCKDAVIDYIKLFVQETYDDYRFEINSHQGYHVPFDFRLRKLSCMVKHRKSGQIIYLVNLYNAATYDPIPSYRLISTGKQGKDTACQLIAHPLVRMRFIYLDQFFLSTKAKDNGVSHFDRMLHGMLESAHTDLKKSEGLPTWAGVYRDEGYDRNQENMRSNVDTPYEVILI